MSNLKLPPQPNKQQAEYRYNLRFEQIVAQGCIMPKQGDKPRESLLDRFIRENTEKIVITKKGLQILGQHDAIIYDVYDRPEWYYTTVINGIWGDNPKPEIIKK